MSDIEGYIQNKLREQGEKILQLENTIKSQQIAIDFLKRDCETASKLLNEATNLDQFKTKMMNIVLDITRKEITVRLDGIKKKNEANFKVIFEETMKSIKRALDTRSEQLEDDCMAIGASIVACLLRKRYLTDTDIATIYAETKRIKDKGLKQINSEMAKDFEQRLKRERRKAR